MVLGFEGGTVGSTYGANETQHRDRIQLEVTQSLNQAFGRRIDFQHALYDGLQSSDEGVHVGQSLFQHIWRVEQSAFHETLRNSPRSRSSENHALRCHTEPISIYENSG